MTIFSLKDSFEQHSDNYGLRVMDRNKHANLSLEDKIIVEYLKNNLPKDKRGILIDAACGTGDRLKMIFDDFGLPQSYFGKIIGLDYSQGMLNHAR